MANSKRLTKTDSGDYIYENYELKKEWALLGMRMHRVWKLYDNGKYIGQPDSVKMANEWINNK